MNSSRHVLLATAAAVMLALPAPLPAHEIVPWGTFGALGSVRARSRSKVHLDQTSPAQVLSFYPAPTDGRDGVFQFSLGTSVDPLSGDMLLTGPKNAWGILLPDDASLAAWQTRIAGLLARFLESKGDVVTGVAVDFTKWHGLAKFKTKPTPIGPIHKVTLDIDARLSAVIMLQGGGTKKGAVKLTINSKGAMIGF